MSSRLSAWLRVPAPAVFLIGAAVASNLVPALAHIPNHPVQVLVTLVGAHASGGAAVLRGVGEFALQMAVGAVVGIAAGFGLRRFLRVALPSQGLYAVRALTAAVAIYGAATVARGSGFLAVLI